MHPHIAINMVSCQYIRLVSDSTGPDFASQFISHFIRKLDDTSKFVLKIQFLKSAGLGQLGGGSLEYKVKMVQQNLTAVLHVNGIKSQQI